ncbi:MAG TPA: DUF916 domain-containing protein [Candidatus Saccharimonadales bacterium]|nr:DUF916 domain-containing protein [Candidatus Saccharimonadales bacterium]
MIQRRIPAIFASLALAVTIAVSALAPVTAATNTAGGNGLKISPVRTDLVILPGKSATVPVNVQNVTKSTANLQVLINDFMASNKENGEPALILDSNKSAPSHGLKQFIAPISDVTLKPNEQKTVKVTINVPKDAAGGGYFGAVRFAPAGTNSDKNVTLSASVASLILVKVPGDIKDDLKLASLSAQSGDTTHVVFTSDKNITAAVRFENKGNVQEEPFGKVVLKKGSKVLQTSEINDSDPRGNVLPDSTRKFEIPLKKVDGIGKYTIEGNFGYGSNGQLLSGKTTFYVIPLPLIILAAVLLAIILFLIFALPRLIRAGSRRNGRR